MLSLLGVIIGFAMGYAVATRSRRSAPLPLPAPIKIDLIPPIISRPRPADCDEIAALARRIGWTCEKWPGKALWYRVQSQSALGVSWQLIQGSPHDGETERRDRGLRWLTNDIRIPHLWLEIFPRVVYERMKKGLSNVRISASRSLDGLKFIHETAPSSFGNEMLDKKYVLLTIIPSAKTIPKFASCWTTRFEAFVQLTLARKFG